MKLVIKWQRLLDDSGRTCERCGVTEKEVEGAAEQLRQSLAHLGVEVLLEKGTLSPEEFLKDPMQSNRVWINGRPMEDWLKAEVGQSACCGPCGDAECRTITVKGRTFEEVPRSLVFKAGLVAFASLRTTTRNDIEKEQGD